MFAVSPSMLRRRATPGRSPIMTTVEQKIAPPERAGGQGLDHNQEESGNRAIVALLTDPVHGPITDIVAPYRHGPPDEDGNPTVGAYEVWAARGMVRFRRFYDPQRGGGEREGGGRRGRERTD